MGGATIEAAAGWEMLGELSRMRDPLGVLSLYAGSDAEVGVRHAPREGEIALEQALRDLRDRLAAGGSEDVRRAVERRLAECAARIEEVVAPPAGGRGVALFVPLSGGEARRLPLPAAVPAAALLGPAPCLRPLLHVAAAGEPAGMVCVSARDVRVIDRRMDHAEEVERVEIPDESTEWRRMQGPAAANPAQAQHSSSQVDLYKRRLEEHRERFLADAARRVARVASARGWSRMVVAGDQRLAGALADGLPASAPEALLAPKLPRETLAATGVAELLEPVLEAARRDRQVALVRAACDAARASGGTAALGVDDTLAALEEGRVHRLLIDPEQEIPGGRAPDGRLVPAGEIPPGARADQVAPEAGLIEPMLRRAFEIDAEIVPVEGEAAALLADAGGVAALLRW